MFVYAKVCKHIGRFAHIYIYTCICILYVRMYKFKCEVTIGMIEDFSVKVPIVTNSPKMLNVSI